MKFGYRTQLNEDARLGYAHSPSGWVTRGAGVASPFFDAIAVAARPLLALRCQPDRSAVL
jgi:hypothetical protein